MPMLHNQDILDRNCEIEGSCKVDPKYCSPWRDIPCHPTICIIGILHSRVLQACLHIFTCQNILVLQFKAQTTTELKD